MAAAVAMILFASTLLICAWMCLNWLWLKPKKLEKQLRQQGFQGNSYRFWFGDKKEDMSMAKARSKSIPLHHDIAPRILPFLHKHVSVVFIVVLGLSFFAGHKSFIWSGPSPRMVIMDPEMIKEILNKSYIYQKPPTSQLFKLFIFGLPFFEGDKWAKHRRLLNPAFNTEKLKCMLPAFDLCSFEMIKKWQDMFSEGKSSCVVDVWPSLQTLTIDVISRTAFGSSYEEGSRVFELQVEQARLAVQASGFPDIFEWSFLPTKRNRRMKEIDKQVRSVLKDVIDKKMKAVKSGKGCTDDLLGILLEANLKEAEQGNKNVGMSIEDVIEECKVFYFAGLETTSVLLVWTMILLSMHPNWQDRAREEVNQVIGNDKVNVDHLSRLKVVTMILFEVLRLYPPVSIILRRKKKMEGTELGDSTSLQAEMDIILPIILMHHDHGIWGADAKEFNPERFSEGVLNATNGQIAAFFPFGGGPRICIGQNFALLEAKLAMVRILKNFSFQLSPSYTHAPSSRITIQPQFGANLILHKL